MVVEALELERERASDAQVAVGPQSACLLDGVRVSHHVGHRARRAGPLDVRQRVAGLAVLGSPLEAAVLVEQAGVQREDALADDVEAKVAGLDDARVDRADGDLVHALAMHGDHPRGRVLRVRDERAQRLVAVEVQPMEVVRLALVPIGGRQEVDDRRHAAIGGEAGQRCCAAAGRRERGAPRDGVLVTRRPRSGKARAHPALAHTADAGCRLALRVD